MRYEMKFLKNLYLQYIERKLSNKITFVIGVIFVIQVVMVFVMYSYSYHIRREEIVENNIQILHQVNTNYFAGIIEEIDTASMEIFYDKVFTCIPVHQINSILWMRLPLTRFR